MDYPPDRPFVPVLIAITYLLPENLHKKCYDLYRSDFYKPPEAKSISWEKLCRFFQSYLYSKYGDDFYTEEIEYNDMEIARIIRNERDYMDYLGNYIYNPFYKYDQFIERVKQCHNPIIHG